MSIKLLFHGENQVAIVMKTITYAELYVTTTLHRGYRQTEAAQVKSLPHG